MSTPEAKARILEHHRALKQWRKNCPSQENCPALYRPNHSFPVWPAQADFTEPGKKGTWQWKPNGEEEFQRAISFHKRKVDRFDRLRARHLHRLFLQYDADFPKPQPRYTVFDIKRDLEFYADGGRAAQLGLTPEEIESRIPGVYREAAKKILKFAKYDPTVVQFGLADEPFNGMARILNWCNEIMGATAGVPAQVPIFHEGVFTGQFEPAAGEITADAQGAQEPTINKEIKSDSAAAIPEPSPRHAKAYREYEAACVKAERELTDKEAYNIYRNELCDDRFELPILNTWKRYVGRYRNATGTQKNHRRAGRSGRSIVGTAVAGMRQKSATIRSLQRPRDKAD